MRKGKFDLPQFYRNTTGAVCGCAPGCGASNHITKRSTARWKCRLIWALISMGVGLKMDDQNADCPAETDSKRPGGVALAVIWLIIGSVVNLLGLAMSAPLSRFSWVLGAFFATAIIVSCAAFALKRWAYWAFLAIVVLLALNNLSDLMLLAVGMRPEVELQISHITSTIISFAVAIYFCTSSVKQAFGVEW